MPMRGAVRAVLWIDRLAAEAPRASGRQRELARRERAPALLHRLGLRLWLAHWAWLLRRRGARWGRLAWQAFERRQRGAASQPERAAPPRRLAAAGRADGRGTRRQAKPMYLADEGVSRDAQAQGYLAGREPRVPHLDGQRGALSRPLRATAHSRSLINLWIVSANSLSKNWPPSPSRSSKMRSGLLHSSMRIFPMRRANRAAGGL